MKLKLFTISVCLSYFLSFGANYPFPRNKVLFGIKTTQDVSSIVQSTYETWLATYYVEQDTLARITWDNRGQTASEGIAYGMLIMVCMDNAINNTRDKFDKLWRYYKKFRGSSGVMHWKIDEFSNVASGGQTGATDAELDAAAALILAYRQWGDEKYRTDAQELIGAIWRTEINADGFIKPGDAWDDRKNPSYFNIGAMELFKSVDTNNWSKVISNSFDLLNKVCDTATGLPPDWCSQDGYTVDGFGWEAIRVPWRMAWAYSWFGTNEASVINKKIVHWVRGATNDDPTEIQCLYTLSGVPTDTTRNAAYVGGLTCAGMVDASNQAWVDDGFSATQNSLSNTYYKKTLQVLYSLLLSGNFSLMVGTESVSRFSPVEKTMPQVRAKQMIIRTGHNKISGQHFSLTGKKMIDCGSTTVQPLIQLW
ncbi:MAG: hypothetical protein JW915_01230 [Chitinispirillaceae bacterium]|nr:hypothetical protein [Chitinispirillaceae bacterium]